MATCLVLNTQLIITCSHAHLHTCRHAHSHLHQTLIHLHMPSVHVHSRTCHICVHFLPKFVLHCWCTGTLALTLTLTLTLTPRIVLQIQCCINTEKRHTEPPDRHPALGKFVDEYPRGWSDAGPLDRVWFMLPPDTPAPPSYEVFRCRA